MPNVTIVGSYIAALVFETDRLPGRGETVVARRFHTTDGGKGSNMAIAARRLGARAHFVGRIGRDDHGRRFRSLLAAEGVGSEAVTESDDAPTGIGVIVLDAGGASTIVIEMGANDELGTKLVAAHALTIAAADVVLSPLEIPLAGALAAAMIASRAGKKAILNPAPAVDLRGQPLDEIFALTPNETEARVCLGLAPDDPTPDERLAERLLGLGPKHVIITRGERGALWASAGGLVSAPALRVTVVDTVGAGDAFNAGLAVALAEGGDVAEGIALGITAASLSTEAHDTIASYPERAAVDRRVAELRGALGLP